MYASIITARTKSSRLPEKILKKINKKNTSIDILILRAKKIGYPVILATSTNSTDDYLCRYVKKNHDIIIFRGSEKNKILRWHDCFHKFKIKKACMIDGDDICFDFMLYKKAMKTKLNSHDLIRGPEKIITGCFMYIFKISIIKRLKKISKNFSDTEMIEPFIKKLKCKQKTLQVDKLYKSKNIRLTLDYKEDLVFFKKIFQKFSVIESTTKILKFLTNDKDISKINYFREASFLKNQKKKIGNIIF
jgi:spore coat polysaccharide biosynthesis protein SpsF